MSFYRLLPYFSGEELYEMSRKDARGGRSLVAIGILHELERAKLSKFGEGSIMHHDTR